MWAQMAAPPIAQKYWQLPVSFIVIIVLANNFNSLHSLTIKNFVGRCYDEGRFTGH